MQFYHEIHIVSWSVLRSHNECQYYSAASRRQIPPPFYVPRGFNAADLPDSIHLADPEACHFFDATVDPSGTDAERSKLVFTFVITIVKYCIIHNQFVKVLFRVCGLNIARLLCCLLQHIYVRRSLRQYSYWADQVALVWCDKRPLASITPQAPIRFRSTLITRTYIHTDVNIRVIGLLGTQMPFIHVFTYPYLLMSIPKPGCRIILSCNPAEAVRGANADAAPAQPESKANPNNLNNVNNHNNPNNLACCWRRPCPAWVKGKS